MEVVSLSIGLVGIAITLGMLIGGISGYFGAGWMAYAWSKC